MSSPATHRSFDIKYFYPKAKLEKKITHFRKNEIIFSQGDRSDALYYLDSGIVKLTVVSRDGREAIVAVVDGGSFFGENCILPESAVRFQSSVALTNVQVVKVEASLVKGMLSAGGQPALDFIGVLVRQNRRIQQDLASRQVESSEKSLARVISSLAEVTKHGGASPAKLSQQTLADMIGTSRQHVNALMKRLRKAGLPGSISPIQSSRSNKRDSELRSIVESSSGQPEEKKRA
ncbi:MAG TPA: Crp/Fnr family transcriptional regulator [Candidatus Sulfotelmatobacter sp.]|nr:Crp/Fnr family transcriptional regulator [Candidatus Sulfotelmatobacter sp.]